MRVRPLLFLIGILCLSTITLGADKPDFSGSYTLNSKKGDAHVKKGEVWTLTVVQSESSVEVTEVQDGKTTTNKYSTDGQEGAYVSPGGAKGVCKGQLKGKNLILESLVVSRPSPNGAPVQLHTKERWELSRDLKTLTIHYDVDSPGLAFNIFNPWTQIYNRD